MNFLKVDKFNTTVTVSLKDKNACGLIARALKGRGEKNKSRDDSLG